MHLCTSEAKEDRSLSMAELASVENGQNIAHFVRLSPLNKNMSHDGALIRLVSGDRQRST